MNYKANHVSKNYKKIEPISINNNHICRCQCHDTIRNNNKEKHLLLLDEKNI